MKTRKALGIACLAIFSTGIGMAQNASAAVTSYLGNGQLGAFNAAAGNPPISLDFDSIASGTNVTGNTISGVTLSSTSGNSLIVVDATTTVSFCCGAQYRLYSTSGANVLSPGGTNLAGGPDILQRDGLQIDFATPVSAFGIDLLFQSLDGFSLAGATVYGPDGTTVLFSNGFLSVPAADGGGAFFLGFVSDSAATNIGRIVFNDDDDDSVNPDSNLGYDTLRFVAQTGAVPEPETYAMMLAGLGLLGFAARRRKQKTA